MRERPRVVGGTPWPSVVSGYAVGTNAPQPLATTSNSTAAARERAPGGREFALLLEGEGA